MNQPARDVTDPKAAAAAETPHDIAEPAAAGSSYHLFDDDVVRLRVTWSQCAIASQHAWERCSQNAQSDSAPFGVKDKDGFRGKAKPGFIKPDVSRAAHEKIASDLAALLDLPIPPVTLFRIPEPVPPDHRTKQPGDPFVCVSAWAFPSCDEWRIHASVITEQEKASTIVPLSAVWVFESWISADDRDYGKHILVSPTGKPPLRIACVDYAFSLSKSWQAGRAAPGAVPWKMPFEVAKRDAATVAAMAARIEKLEVPAIEGIVKRVGAEWLPPPKGELILKNLLQRREGIRQIVGVP